MNRVAPGPLHGPPLAWLPVAASVAAWIAFAISACAVPSDHMTKTPPVVTAENLFDYEAFWPYQIQLTEPWKPPGHVGDFAWGLGVLVRVREDGQLRVDFSRHGKHWIPAEVTDVVERANRIRTGQETKLAPNVVVALRNRLLDPSETQLAAYAGDLGSASSFLLVHADPRAPGFSEIAKTLAGLDLQPEVVTVLLAEGDRSDAEVFHFCHAAQWPGAFLLDRFARAYSEGFLDSGQRPPFVQIVSPEGRLIFGAPWSAQLGREIPELLSVREHPAS